ncbi:MAG: hypothetical protein AAGI53_10675 [Planctomycetota bacterium]
MTPGVWFDDGIAGPPLPEAHPPPGEILDAVRQRTPASPSALDQPSPDATPATLTDLPDESSPETAAVEAQDDGSGIAFVERLEGVIPGVGGRDALSGFMMTMGVGVIVMVLLRRLRKNAIKRRRAASIEPTERIEEIRHDASKRGKAEGLTADLEEMARHFAAILDNKAMRIELLIQQADERIAKLDGATPDTQSFVAPEPRPETRTETRTVSDDPINGNDFEPTPADDHDRVYKLADEGHDPVQIAQELNRPVGEVELILALRAS